MRLNRAKFLGAARILFGIVVLGVIIYKGEQSWTQIITVLQEINFSWLALAIVAQAIAFVFLPLPSFLALRFRNSKFSFWQAARMFFLSQPAKYLPGSIWVFPARIYLVRSAGFSLSTALHVLLFETVALFVSSSAAGLINISYFPLDVRNLAIPIALLVTVGFLFLCLLPVPNRLSKVLPSKWRTHLQPGSPTLSASIFASFISVTGLLATWFFSGISLFLIFKALHAQIAPATLLACVSAFGISWLVGFLIIISPGGIGVREATFVFLLSNLLAGPLIIVAAVFCRFVWSLCEIMLYFLYTLMPTKKNAALKAGIKK